jgi:hypothetical protein
MQHIRRTALLSKILLQMPAFAFRLGSRAETPIQKAETASNMSEATTLEADLLYEVRDGIGRVAFKRPQARNSLTFGMGGSLSPWSGGPMKWRG